MSWNVIELYYVEKATVFQCIAAYTAEESPVKHWIVGCSWIDPAWTIKEIPKIP